MNKPNRFDILSQEEEVLYAPADCFEPYPDSMIRLKIHTGEKYSQLKESIIINGVIEPIIVMHSQNRGMFTIIAGHNRVNVCSELNLEVPYYLKADISKEEADLICIETNLLNRQHDELLPSELASILHVKNEILKNQGKRTDLMKDQVGLRLNTADVIGKEFKLSATNVKRYLRLIKLNVDLLNLVDKGIISLNAGVEISFLKSCEQAELYDYIIHNNYKLSLKSAKKLKEVSIQTSYSIDILAILKQSETTSNKKVSFSINELQKYIPSHDIENLKSIIVKALKLYYDNNNG